MNHTGVGSTANGARRAESVEFPSSSIVTPCVHPQVDATLRIDAVKIYKNDVKNV